MKIRQARSVRANTARGSGRGSVIGRSMSLIFAATWWQQLSALIHLQPGSYRCQPLVGRPASPPSPFCRFLNSPNLASLTAELDVNCPPTVASLALNLPHPRRLNWQSNYGIVNLLLSRYQFPLFPAAVSDWLNDWLLLWWRWLLHQLQFISCFLLNRRLVYVWTRSVM